MHHIFHSMCRAQVTVPNVLDGRELMTYTLYQNTDRTVHAAIQNVTQWFQLTHLLMTFRPMYKGGCDVISGKRCLYYYCVYCTLLVKYSWCYLVNPCVDYPLCACYTFTELILLIIAMHAFRFRFYIMCCQCGAKHLGLSRPLWVVKCHAKTGSSEVLDWVIW